TRDRLVAVVDVVVRGFSGLVAAELHLEVEMRRYGGVHGLRHERRAGVVEVDTAGFYGGRGPAARDGARVRKRVLAACACRLIIAAHFSSGKTGRLAATDFAAEPFHAAWWLPSPNGQTIAGRLLRQPSPPPFERVRIDTPDGDFLD